MADIACKMDDPEVAEKWGEEEIALEMDYVATQDEVPDMQPLCLSVAAYYKYACPGTIPKGLAWFHLSTPTPKSMCFVPGLETQFISQGREASARSLRRRAEFGRFLPHFVARFRTFSHFLLFFSDRTSLQCVC